MTDAKTGRRKMARFLNFPVSSGEPYYVNIDKIQRVVTNYEITKVRDSSRCYLILDDNDEITVSVELPIDKVLRLLSNETIIANWDKL